MSRETVLLKSEEKTSRDSVAEFLRNLASKVESGEVVLKQEERELRLDLPQNLVLEVKVEEKQKGGGVKKSLEVEIEWYEGQEAHGSKGVELA